MFEKLKQKYRDEGYKEGYSKGRLDEITEQANKKMQETIKKMQHEQKQKEQELPQIIDNTMLWIKSSMEIVNTDYFKTVLFDNTDLETIKSALDFLDYLEHTHEVKLQYPQTYLHIPVFKKAVEQVYENRLLIKEAEGF